MRSLFTEANSFVLGLNNTAGGSMIMTNSNISSLGGMGGGGLVVSSGAGNKPQLPSAPNMLGQPHHPGGHNVSQVQSHGKRKFLFLIRNLLTGFAKRSNVKSTDPRAKIAACPSH